MESDAAKLAANASKPVAARRQEVDGQLQAARVKIAANKEKLLEIAKKNAAKILKSGGDYLGMDTVGILLGLDIYLGHFFRNG